MNKRDPLQFCIHGGGVVLTVMGQRERKYLLAVSVLNHFLSRLRQTG